ncbi:coiled-coil domain-containing protein [Candidatus Methylacidithermus pantelleriae]|uniref:Uncharacterized protein n=1 Tax=Candidatus Methylacidithermus pantelleriae TaxID=2744239 RepID=A0A8J2FMV5_9BACT|nr:hypothetical protein [Candidatus Methylacidithermus pantelleriae]CAF0689897.1 hypothetical protein MPNT_10422 [Candidatus Methylacidithermus pantelleriae]
MSSGFDSESSYLRYLRQKELERTNRRTSVSAPGQAPGDSEKSASKPSLPPPPTGGPRFPGGKGKGGQGDEEGKRVRSTFGLRQLIGAAAVFLSSWLIYLSLRQSQVEIVWQWDQLPSPTKVYLVGDFTGDLRALRQEYRLAEEPFEQEIRVKKESLRRVESDLAGLEERIGLLRNEKGTVEKELKHLVEENEKKSQEIWERKGLTLERKRKQKLLALEQLIESRAQSLHLSLKLRADAPKDPEVWVNAFRLALYDAPRDIPVGKERKWAEALLEDWHRSEEEYQKEKASVGKELERLRVAIRERAASYLARLRELDRRIHEAEEEKKPIETERQAGTVALDASKGRKDSIQDNYALTIRNIPKRYVVGELSRGADGRYHWIGWDQDPKSAIRHWYLWACTEKDREQYWSLVQLPLERFTKVVLVLRPESFVRVRDLLQ